MEEVEERPVAERPRGGLLCLHVCDCCGGDGDGSFSWYLGCPRCRDRDGDGGGI